MFFCPAQQERRKFIIKSPKFVKFSEMGRPKKTKKATPKPSTSSAPTIPSTSSTSPKPSASSASPKPSTSSAAPMSPTPSTSKDSTNQVASTSASANSTLRSSTKKKPTPKKPGRPRKSAKKGDAGTAPPTLVHSALWSYLDYLVKDYTADDMVFINAEISNIITKHLKSMDSDQIGQIGKIECESKSAQSEGTTSTSTSPPSALIHRPIWMFFDFLLKDVSSTRILPLKEEIVAFIESRPNK